MHVVSIVVVVLFQGLDKEDNFLSMFLHSVYWITMLRKIEDIVFFSYFISKIFYINYRIDRNNYWLDIIDME